MATKTISISEDAYNAYSGDSAHTKGHKREEGRRKLSTDDKKDYMRIYSVKNTSHSIEKDS